MAKKNYTIPSSFHRGFANMKASKPKSHAISPSKFGESYGGLAGNMLGGAYAKNPLTKQARTSPTSLANPITHGTPPGIPLDPAAQAAETAAVRNLAVGTATGTLNQGYIGQDTGYSPTGARDYSNPYSQAALLQESYKRSKLGTTNSYAAQGQLYSGAYGRMQGENDRNYSIGSNALQTAASRAYTSNSLGQLQNAATYGTSLSDASWQALAAALGINLGGS